MRYDTVVVGAGIVGLAVAREVTLRTPGASVLVLEKEDDVAVHQTGHNSGVVHGGIYYAPGTLKARLCVEGARLLYDYAAEKGIPHERCGKLIVAVREDELGRLDELERRGRANEVPGLRRVSGSEIPGIEPRAAGVAALHAPNTGIIDYVAVARAYADDVRAAGGELRFGTRVRKVTARGDSATVQLDDETVEARRVIACAGLWSDRLARRSGAAADPRIAPFRGAYLDLRASDELVVRGMIYPVPDPELPFLGVHVTRRIDGGVSLGPTAIAALSRTAYRSPAKLGLRDAWELAAWPGSWRLARRFWRTALTELRFAASRRAFVEACAVYVPGLTVDDLDGAASAGIRAQALGRDGSLSDDFVISRQGPVSHVRNAPSPAATSSLALAREVLDRIERDAA